MLSYQETVHFSKKNAESCIRDATASSGQCIGAHITISMTTIHHWGYKMLHHPLHSPGLALSDVDICSHLWKTHTVADIW